MKKAVKILGLLLVLGVLLVSCEDEGIKDGKVELTQQNLEGIYNIKAVSVPIAIDTDKDGKTNTNLLLEVGDNCIWDNTWEFLGPSMFLKEAGIKCDPSSPATILDESFKFNSTTKTINFMSGSTEPYTNVEVSIVNGKKEIAFKTYDMQSKQDWSFTLVQK